jgi:phosphoribosylaminoimidazole-succinocarboxamide synthase
MLKDVEAHMVVNRVLAATCQPPVIVGRSKRIYKLEDNFSYVEMIPSLRSYTHERDEMIDGTDELRLDFYELAAAQLSKAGINHALVERVSPTGYIAKACSNPPFEVIVKNVAIGSTIRKYPGLFPEGHRFVEPVVKFDYRIDPEDQCIAEDYIREAGHDPMKWKGLARHVNSVLSEWLSPRVLLDFCIVIGQDTHKDECIISEISPDAMRLRGERGEPLDKDLFRHGASGREVLTEWRRLVQSLR